LKLTSYSAMPTGFGTKTFGATSTVDYAGVNTPTLTGTIATTSGGTAVTGTGTLFTSQLVIGAQICEGGTTVGTVAAIATKHIPDLDRGAPFTASGQSYTGCQTTVSAESYGNLKISGSGTKSAAGNLGIAGDLTIDTATLNWARSPPTADRAAARSRSASAAAPAASS
jgi:hypothetical protein